MALFDALIVELDQRFGLGGRAEALVGQTVGYIADPGQGGLRGFIERFKDAGLGDLAASWITKVRAGLPLAADQLDAALGSGFGAGLAGRLALPVETVREALAYAVPRLVDLLTPAGFLQDTLSGEVQTFLAAAGAAALPAAAAAAPPPMPPTPIPQAPAPQSPAPADARPTPAAPAAPAAPTLVRAAAAPVSAAQPAPKSAPSPAATPATAGTPAAPKPGPATGVAATAGPAAASTAAGATPGPASAAPVVGPRGAAAAPAPRPPAAPAPRRRVPLWGWLAGCAWAGLLAWWALNPMATAPAPRAAATPASAPAPAPASAPATTVAPRAAAPARLFLSNEDGKVAYAGLVADERTRATVLDQLKGAFGEANLDGRVDVDPRVGPAPWLAALGAVLKELNLPGADLLLEGDTVKVGGWLSDPERAGLLDLLRPLCGEGMSYGFLGDKRDEAFAAAAERTRSAIAALSPGYGGPELVKALNLWVIHFGPNSAELMTGSRALIPIVARAIQDAPPVLVVEIAGHTDSTGQEPSNQALSEARAAAVRDALVDAGVPPARLQARGYGSQRPVASDETAAGRFRNRRIEFVVVQ